MGQFAGAFGHLQPAAAKRQDRQRGGWKFHSQGIKKFGASPAGQSLRQFPQRRIVPDQHQGFGASTAPAMGVLPRAVVKLRETWPSANIRVSDTSFPNVLADLREGRFDLAISPTIGADPVPAGEFNVEVLFRIHPLVRPDPVVVDCALAPARTPHLLAQLQVRDGGDVEVECRLSEGAYRLEAEEDGQAPAVFPHLDEVGELHDDVRPRLHGEVLLDSGGFDLIIGNPPYLGGQALSGSYGH